MIRIILNGCAIIFALFIQVVIFLGALDVFEQGENPMTATLDIFKTVFFG